MDDLAWESEWQRKGATLSLVSDKTARKEFGLTQDGALSTQSWP
jgi:hypothetical protein